MSVRQSLLAILGQGPSYGYQLRAEFERRTGGSWPLNIGQVYSTLERLERDDLVERSAQDDESHVFYAITDAGRSEVDRWMAQPVDRVGASRDELAVKFAMAVTMPGVDIPTLVQTQRTASLRALQDLTRTKAAAGRVTKAADLAWSLVLEGMIFSIEAETRWLDHVESSMTRARRQGLFDPDQPTTSATALPVAESDRTGR